MRKAVIYIFSFVLISVFLLSVSPAFSPATAQTPVQICAPIANWSEYLLCTQQTGHVSCGTPVYACCYVPPTSPSFVPECLPPPSCPSPNQCLSETSCPDNYVVSNTWCPIAGLQMNVCCAPLGGPPPVPGPTPTITVGQPPSFCGDHLQPCCGIQYGGDPGLGTCDPQPFGQPSLFCTSIALSESICCLQNDPEPRCFTGIGVTPIPPSTSTSLDIFCTDANGTPTRLPTKWIYTALGCLEYDAYKLVSSLLVLLVRVSGGIGLIFLIFSAFQFVTAGGDPKKVQAGKELLTSTLIGLSLIALSIVILNFIGVNVLGLPSLGFNLSP